MLIELRERILDTLESVSDAAVLLGVDYEKAFNHMDHAVCIRKLKDLGASDSSILLVRAFLKDRKMTISIDGHSATPITISRGSPQGSLLGCLLTVLQLNCLLLACEVVGGQPIPDSSPRIALMKKTRSSGSLVRASTTPSQPPSSTSMIQCYLMSYQWKQQPDISPLLPQKEIFKPLMLHPSLPI